MDGIFFRVGSVVIDSDFCSLGNFFGLSPFGFGFDIYKTAGVSIRYPFSLSACAPIGLDTRLDLRGHRRRGLDNQPGVSAAVESRADRTAHTPLWPTFPFGQSSVFSRRTGQQLNAGSVIARPCISNKVQLSGC